MLVVGNGGMAEGCGSTPAISGHGTARRGRLQLPDLIANLRVLSRAKGVATVSLAVSTAARRRGRGGALPFSGEHAAVVPKPVVARAFTLHGDSDTQDREGGGALSRASHGKPMCGGTPMSSTVAAMRFCTLPESGWCR
jgi:hypothetical protein